MDVQSRKCDDCKVIYSEKTDIDLMVRTTVMIQKQGAQGGPGPGMGGMGSESKSVDQCKACQDKAGVGNTISEKAVAILTPFLA
jgi:hypothetical protein